MFLRVLCYMYRCYVCVHVCEVRKSSQGPVTRVYRLLSEAMWLLEAEPRSSGRAASVPNR